MKTTKQKGNQGEIGFVYAG